MAHASALSTLTHSSADLQSKTQQVTCFACDGYRLG